MKLTTEQLNMLERLGATFFTIKEAAIVLQVPYIDLKNQIEDSNSEAHQVYHKGKFQSELEMRESIIKMAKRGSNPAQKMLLDILQKMNTANL